MTDTKKLNSTFLKNVIWQFGGNASQAILAGILLLTMGKYLSATAFGEFSVIMSFIYVSNYLLEPRIQDIAAKHFSDLMSDKFSKIKNDDYFFDFLLIEIFLKLIPCLGVIFFSPLIVSFGNLPEGSERLLIIASVGTYLAKLGNGLSIGILRALGRSDIIAYCGIADLSLRLFMTILVIYFFHINVEVCIIILTITGCIAILIQWIFLCKIYGGVLDSFKQWRFKSITGRTFENRKFLISNIGISIADLMNKDLDITLISPLVSHDQIGIYKMSKNITMLIWRAVDPFYFAMIPEASKLIKLNKFSELANLFKKSSIIITIVTILGSMITYATFIYFGSRILNGEYILVPEVMIWMMLGVIISGPMVCAPAILIAINKPEISLYSSVIGTITGLLFFTELTSNFGIIGSAIAWSMSLSIGFLILTIISLSEIRNMLAKQRYNKL